MTLPLANTFSPALILFAHGTLLCDGASTLGAHAERIRRQGRFSRVVCGFLNYSHPPIEEAVSECVEAGLRQIIVVPWFLVPGKFVRDDLPPRLEAVRASFPHIQLVVTAPLGPDPALGLLLSLAAHRAVGQSNWDGLPAHTSRLCGNNPVCPNHGSDWCLSALSRRMPPQPALLSQGRPDHPFGTHDVLLVVAHGSPRLRTVGYVEDAARGAARAIGTSRLVTAYLDCNQPDIPTGVVMAADILGDDTERGGSIVVVPFFLHAGKHVARDIPNLLREGMARVPGITVRLGPHLGCLPELADLAAQRAQHSARPHG